MTTPSDGPVRQPASTSNGARSKEEIEADIERTRQQLGETVDALSHKLDVKSRLREQAEHGRERAVHELHVRRRQAQQQPAVPVAVVTAVVLLTTLAVWRSRRRKG